MIFAPTPQDEIRIARTDALEPLASYSKHGFDLDGEHWPSVEHYYQAMKFDDEDLRMQIRDAAHPEAAVKLAKKHRRQTRTDWKKIRETIMTRGVYIKCRTHPDVVEALLATGDEKILENSQYDYYWGCGRDGRGENAYGRVLMNVRDKLRDE
jgi:ribA/ribD-fused uncharacterized protein